MSLPPFGLTTLQVSAEASLVRPTIGPLELTTPAQSWSWALLGDLTGSFRESESATGARIAIDLELVAGSVGVFLFGDDTNVPLGREQKIERVGRHQVLVRVDGPLPKGFCVRSAESGPARVRIFDIRVNTLQRFDLTPVIRDVLPAMLLYPGDQALETIARALSHTLAQPISTAQIGALELSPGAVPLEIPSLGSIFDDPVGHVIVQEAQHLTNLLDSYNPEKLIQHIGYFGLDHMRRYIRQNVVRVYYLVQLLRTLGLREGTIFELGSFFGNFAGALRRLGYDVTAVDRYDDFGGALAAYTRYMRSLGVRVVQTSREDEAARITDLGRFDAVISMAVIEHIPHTPRHFLTMLASHVAPGGILALDTPNVARYWNRLELCAGKSIFQDLRQQYDCEPPFEGHHREYTAEELVWMLERVGCTGTIVRRFDYNLFQFDRLEPPHDAALLTMTLDPTQTDTILVAGRL